MADAKAGRVPGARQDDAGGPGADFAVSLFVVLHIAPGGCKRSGQILHWAGPLPATQARIKPGHIQ
jgi:hypothetical protein